MAFSNIQISESVNELVKQAIGKTAFEKVSAQGIVAMGNEVLSSSSNTESYFNTMVGRIGKTVMVDRQYRNTLGDLVLTDFEYGQILQKVRYLAPDFVDDETYSLEEGTSVDQYKIYKGTTSKKFFFSRSPYMLPLTTPLRQLKEAFLSYEEMARFISLMKSQIRTKLELSYEMLGLLCMSNFMASISKTPNRVINLLGDYIESTGSANITPKQALYDPDFLRYASTIIRYSSELLTSYSYEYGDTTAPNFTPKQLQRLKVNTRFNMALESEVEYNAFHKEMVSLHGYENVNYWQSISNPMSINITTSDGDSVEIDNIVAFLFDRDALGTYKKDEFVLTSPVNAAAAYYNTFWHMKDLWFNDLSENGIIFTLNTNPSARSPFTEQLAKISANSKMNELQSAMLKKPVTKSKNQDKSEEQRKSEEQQKSEEQRKSEEQ